MKAEFEPVVTIIMPTYNTEAGVLIEAVNSILEQTYKSFELIVIDDGSEICAESALKNIYDIRLHVYSNNSNKGLPYSLNRGITLAKGKYIARMDADDISVARRIERQVYFMEKHESIDVVGAYAQTFGVIRRNYKSAITDSSIKATMLYKNPMVHPTVMIRTKTIREKDIQYSTMQTAEDYSMWSSMAFEYDCCFAVIPAYLLKYRVHDRQLTNIKKDVLKNSEQLIIKNIFLRLNINLSDHELNCYFKYREKDINNKKEFREVKLVLIKIIKDYQCNDKVKKALAWEYFKGYLRLRLKRK